MAIQVRIPPVLRAHTEGARVIEAEGTTVGEVLRELSARFPGLAGALYNDDGQLRRFLNVYLNDEDIRYLGQADTPVQDGDTIALLPALAGGAITGGGKASAGGSHGRAARALRGQNPSRQLLLLDTVVGSGVLVDDLLVGAVEATPIASCPTDSSKGS